MADDIRMILTEFSKSKDDEFNRMRSEWKEQQKSMQGQIDQLMAALLKNHSTKTEVVESQSGGFDHQKYNMLLNRLPIFEFDADSPVDFSVWINRHGQVIEKDGKEFEESCRVKMLLERLGTRTFETYSRFKKPKDVWAESYAETKKCLEELFSSKITKSASRMMCLNLIHESNESLAEYTGRVNDLFDMANFSEMTSESLKCLIWIFGLKSLKQVKLRHHLLNFLESKEKSNVVCTVQMLHGESDRFEQETSERKLLVSKHVDVNKISNSNRRLSFDDVSTSEDESVNQVQFKPKSVCFNCKKTGHALKNCKGKPSKCSKCGRKGHLDEFCDRLKRWEQKKQIRKSSQNTNVVEVEVPEVNSTRQYAPIEINGIEIEFQVDTGSDATLLNVKDWEKLGSPKLSPQVLPLKDASGSVMEVLGEVVLDFKTRNSSGSGIAYIVKRDNLLGLSWIKQCDHMRYHMEQMVANVNAGPIEHVLKEKFSEVFEEGLGRCTKVLVDLPVKVNSKPKYVPKRSVPYAAVPVVEKELERLLELGVIQPITHSEWAAPIVCVRKANGKIRVCADFSTGVNASLDDYSYPLPVPEDIFACMNGGGIFSTIDFKDAYLQLELSDETKKMLVINTHKGLFQYTRLPFGVKSAPGLFQQVMDTMIAGIPGTVAYLDDVLVMGRNKQEHDQNLFKVFERIAEYGFRVQMDKCSFGKPKIRYLGFEMDVEGRRPLKEKVEPIVNMPVPNNEAKLKSYLGMITYYGAFIPNLKRLRGPLDELTRKSVPFTWLEKHQKAFEEIQKVLVSDLNLMHYDPKLPITIAADACEYGIGAVISHVLPSGQRKPVAHASRTLTDCEKRYSQIEKEALGLIFAMKKFHKFVFGRRFLLETDHKPLLAIFGSKKGVPVHSANRLIRWSLLLLGYDFEIKYVNTDKFGYADGLSRLIPDRKVEDEDIVVASIELDVGKFVSEQIRFLPVTSRRLKIELEKDVEMQKLKRAISTGKWKGLEGFERKKDAFCIVDDCIVMAERMVIPLSLRRQILKELHLGHPGMARMKGLARSFVYWPGIDQDIESFVRKCDKCQLNGKMSVKVPLSPWPKTSRVWERIHVDFAGPIDGYYYMVVADAFSKCPEMIQMQNISASTTVNNLEKLFAAYGYPETIVSDNGTQFVSEKFENMCINGGINHITSPAYHPMSNGQAERFVDTLKRALRKTAEDIVKPETVNTILMAYRSTPSDVLGGKAPSEVFLGRKIRTRLSLLKPIEGFDREDIDEKMKSQFDKHQGVKPKNFKKGEGVYTAIWQGNKTKWVKGQIEKVLGSVNFLVKLSSGRLMKRHSNQMKKRLDFDPEKERHEQELMEFVHDFSIPIGIPSTTTTSTVNNGSQLLSLLSPIIHQQPIPQTSPQATSAQSPMQMVQQPHQPMVPQPPVQPAQSSPAQSSNGPRYPARSRKPPSRLRF